MLHALGIDIPRATLSHWVIKSSQLLQPLVNLQQDKILSYDVAYADESTVQVLKEANKEAQSKSYMWVFGGGPPEAFSICYQYHPSRAHAIATEFFEGYSGYLHSDGYQAYDSLAKLNTTVTLVGCWYHLRRKFSEAAKVSKKSGLSEWFLKQIQRLSKAEKFAVTSKLSYEQIVQLRQEKAKPIIDKIKLKLDEQLSKVPEQSLLGKAIAYGLNQWPKLLSYLKDGRLEISNNRMERAIKPFATGRKNWLFANSVAGAKAAAIIFSLVETCKFHEVDVYHWFRHALENLPNCETVEDFEALLPFNCKHITLGK
jgi:transposase